MFGLSKKQIIVITGILIIAVAITYLVPRLIGWQKAKWQTEAFNAGQNSIVATLLNSFRDGKTINLPDGENIYIVTAKLKPKEIKE